VERHRQHTADLVGTTRDLGHHTGRRQRDAPTVKWLIPSPSIAIRIASRTFSKVVERLSHSHQDDVGHQPRPFPRALAGARPFAQIVARHHDLTR
jgi:hypothetical protein